MDPLTLELRSAEAPTIKSTLADSSIYVLGRDGVFEPEGAARADTALRVITEEHQLFVEPGPDANLLVNGRPAAGRTRVRHGDWVTVSNVVYQIKLSEPEPSPGATTTLGVAAATASVRQLGAARGRAVLIGRAEDCTLTIDAPNVSRRHARLVASEGRWILEDLGSTNGTFVNGRRLVAPVELAAGDHVAFASFGYRFTGDALIADGG